MRLPATKEDMQRTIREWGVTNQAVFQAMEKMDRKWFVTDGWQDEAYENTALAIGFGQTISQPYTVARMLELLISDAEFDPGNASVLEIGTGSGWQAGILAQLFKQVYSIEIIPELAICARERLIRLRIPNVEIKTGDGKEGWKERSPFGAIIVAANATEIPGKLVDQLENGGRMVIPVLGEMRRGTKSQKGMVWEKYGDYRFVPLK